MENKYLTIKGNRLIFDYAEKFEIDEYDLFHGEFDVADYRKGMEKLNGNGDCELLGSNYSMKILNRDGLIEIIFSEGNQSIELFGLNKKTLPE